MPNPEATLDRIADSIERKDEKLAGQNWVLGGTATGTGITGFILGQIADGKITPEVLQLSLNGMVVVVVVLMLGVIRGFQKAIDANTKMGGQVVEVMRANSETNRNVEKALDRFVDSAEREHPKVDSSAKTQTQGQARTAAWPEPA